MSGAKDGAILRRRDKEREAHTDTRARARASAQRGAAIEILNHVDGEAADREAARLLSAGG